MEKAHCPVAMDCAYTRSIIQFLDDSPTRLSTSHPLTTHFSQNSRIS